MQKTNSCIIFNGLKFKHHLWVVNEGNTILKILNNFPIPALKQSQIKFVKNLYSNECFSMQQLIGFTIRWCTQGNLPVQCTPSCVKKLWSNLEHIYDNSMKLEKILGHVKSEHWIDSQNSNLKNIWRFFI